MNKIAYTASEAAALLGITPSRVRQMIASGEIEADWFGNNRLITAAALEKAKQRKTKPGPTPKAQPAQPGANSEKHGTIEAQTRTTRKLNKAIKQSADKEMSSRKKGGKQ